MEIQELIRSYQKVRQQTEAICTPLQPEDYIPQPITDVSPPKWHLAHTTWFFENFILAAHKEKYSLFKRNFNFLFNSYYESQGPRIERVQRGFMTRPTAEEVFAYRAHVDAALCDFLGSGAASQEVQSLVALGIEHEQQHQELLLTDIKYILGQNLLLPTYRPEREYPKRVAHDTIRQEYLRMDEGVYHIGHEGDAFCFDNERGAHKVFLHAYQILNRLVSNREYMEFMDDGGYERAELWQMEGWEWCKTNHVQAPLYWRRHYDEWRVFTLYGLQEIEPEAPICHVSYYEAEAFARWKGKRLPTEFEWEATARNYAPTCPEQANLLETNTLHPVGRASENLQFWGDVWEWTQSAYLPYPYYKQDKGALGEYNGKFMVNQMVLRGGSCATSRSHIRATYRNFFHADKRWQFTGIRLAEHV